MADTKPEAGAVADAPKPAAKSKPAARKASAAKPPATPKREPSPGAAALDAEAGDLIKVTVAPRTQEYCRKLKRFMKPGETAWVPAETRAQIKPGSAPAPLSDIMGESDLDDDPVVHARTQRPKTSARERAAKG